jgi:isoleucyl-tRNA synthetase
LNPDAAADLASRVPALAGRNVSVLIWTTTPWTIPVNQALAYGPDVRYSLFQMTAGFDLKGRDKDEFFAALTRVYPLHTSKILIAHDLQVSFGERLEKFYAGLSVPGFEEVEFGGEVYLDELKVTLPSGQVVDTFNDAFDAAQLAGTVARHPMHRLGGFFAEPRPFLPGEFVTTDTGTGLVHMAPDHGEDDFELCKAYGLTPKFAVEGDGKYRADWGWLGGQGSVINPKFNAPDGPICSDLREAGALLAASADYKHSYPHSWRSKAKVIFRCTPQWFVPMDKPHAVEPVEGRARQRWDNEGGALEPGETLREVALAEIERVRFTPEKGRNRIGSMVAGRPDWVLSRQRAWGVPITLFVNRASGEYLVDPAVNSRIVEAVRAEGIDAWLPETAHRFLGPEYDPAEWEPVSDILDVWFDSGTSHAYVLESERWPDLRWPADIYVEGSDQHRGWFQSSLLESCATRGRAPYDAVLTHGFTMDAKGMKMSKSLGNTIDPIKVMETYGADIIRLWALSVDYTEDHRIGDEILKGVADQYRKLRNTFRYLLGALDGFVWESEGVDYAEMPELERYVLARLAELDATMRQAITSYDFNEYVRALIEFCNEDLSAFYFDIRKDRLYCDAPDWVRRRATRTVMDVLFQALIRYAAPVLVFTAEEAWTTRFPERGSVHLLEAHSLPAEWTNPTLVARFAALRSLREEVTEAIEPLRREKVIRSGLEAEVEVPAARVPEAFSDAQLAELFITATVRRAQGSAVTATRTDDHKCGRCWRLLPDVPEDGALCERCETAVGELDAAA